MKTVYLIGGAMGIGKTTVCRELEQMLNRSVFLDGDWCWDSHPFQVTEETKSMVLENIRFLLNQFIRCSAYDNVIFCWVMHQQAIVDTIRNGLESKGCTVHCISLLCDEDSLRARLEKDVAAGIRTPEVIEKSVARIPLYRALNTEKIETDGKTPRAVAEEIAGL